MSKLFERSVINGMELANRLVRSATWEGMADPDGGVTPTLIETMVALARGGVGLIMSSHAYVRPEGQAAPGQIGIYKDELVDGLQKMAGAVHQSGGKIVMQIAHAGNFSAKQAPQPPLVVSNFEGLAKSPRREMTAQDIKEIVQAFGDAARRAKSAGFDGVQIHSAHGYLLNQFLSPLFNRRQDEYGGDIRNRARIHLEIYQAIRAAVGKDYPVLIKLNCADFAENGLTLEDSLQAAKWLFDMGLDAIELSGGLFTTTPKLSPSRPGIDSTDKEAYFKEEASAFKRDLSIPLILVGGIRSFEVAEQLVDRGVADYISMSRPFISEPDLIHRWQAGDRRKSDCKSDNLCFRAGAEGIHCVTNKGEKKKG